MIGTYILAAITLVIAGVALGGLLTVCLGIKRDDRPGGFPAYTNDPMARAARQMIGAGARSPEPAEKASDRQDALRVQPNPRALA